MRHAVLGAGGVGGLMAGALARAGHEVTIVIRPGSQHPPQVHVDSDVLGEFDAPVRVTERLDRPVDVLWVATKAGALREAIREVPTELVGEAVIPLLNGVDHMPPLREAYGAGRVAAGTIRVESERTRPGWIRQSGRFIVVDLAGPDELAGVLERVREELEGAGMRARLVESPEHALWDKLIFLGPFALTSTASGLDMGGIREDQRWRSRIEGAMTEVRKVAAAEGIELTEPTAMIDAVQPTMRPSMQKDAAAGRPLEVAHLAGPVLEGGRRHGIPTPITEELVAIIREKHPAQV